MTINMNSKGKRGGVSEAAEQCGGRRSENCETIDFKIVWEAQVPQVQVLGGWQARGRLMETNEMKDGTESESQRDETGSGQRAAR
ncbi:hypothetical protein Mapa_001437 [Marchantia paleacea]|nr:hypothetical protein Mapa_001437 [Marchantia paleacea]